MTHQVSLLTSQSVACSLMISHFSTLSLYLMKKPASLAESIEVGTNGKGSLVIVWQPLAVREKICIYVNVLVSGCRKRLGQISKKLGAALKSACDRFGC